MAGKGHFIKSNRYIGSPKGNRTSKGDFDAVYHYSWLMDQLRWQWGFLVPVKVFGYCATNLDMTISIMVKP
jgi:hypothetical protein